MLLSSCAVPHGQPRKGAETLAPNEVSECSTALRRQLRSCHGQDGREAHRTSLLGDPSIWRSPIKPPSEESSKGVRGTAMPAFAESAGGLLTDKQLDIIIQGIQSRWSRPGVLDGANPPSYAEKDRRRPATG